MENKNVDTHFISLVSSISIAAWQGLGKIPSPITNKVEMSLESAKISIDMLEMMKVKTKGNLSAEEEKILENVITDLQLNYIDAMKGEAEKKLKDKAAAPEEKSGEKETGEEKNEKGRPGPA
jgi:hypothetical protein